MLTALPIDTVLETIGDWLLLGAWAGVVLFWVIYGLAFKFWERPAGWAIFSFTGSLVLLLAFGLVSRANGGDFEGREWLRIVAAGICLLSSWSLVVVLLLGAWRGSRVDLSERQRKPSDERAGALRRAGTIPTDNDPTL